MLKCQQPTIVGILTFMSRIDFISLEYEISFTTSGPDLLNIILMRCVNGKNRITLCKP